MQVARKLLDDCGAMVTDIKPYSNKLIVFQVNVRLGDWDGFVAGLRRSDMNFDLPAGPMEPRPLGDADGDVFGTISIVASGADSETSNVIPSVPG
ncbi:hypothetical protein C7C56_023025 [Massilia glaciei]|uniref:Uncharacterized protein n=2 Tax=Massilia glaciei TaxID=1524097 RepID=A0A2U2HEU5_9BURK|nr:hypothetical protein C7C56_023025 [Massilia glaciei]